MSGKIETYIKQFEYYKSLADKSMAQCKDEDLFLQLNNNDNSIGVIVNHIAGNMLSRWTNVFTEDGEKEWRNRDREFEDIYDNRSELLAYWEKGWDVLFSVLKSAQDSDLDRVVYIRNMGCTFHDAIIRQLCHYSYHIGQIVFISKSILGKEFTSLSIPKGKSKTYNAQRFSNEKSMKHFTDDL